MIVDVLKRLTEGVRRAVDDGYYRDFAAAHTTAVQTPSLEAAVRRDAPWAFLAEVKPASPSRGDLVTGDIQTQARRMLTLYRDYGTTGISVLTERETFRGSLDLLAEAAALRPAAPVLMKDFVIAEEQLDAARAAGASAVLLIHHLFARGHTDLELPDMIRAAHARGLEVLLEVDSAPAFEHAATTEADLIGINNRDLRTLEMDPERAPDILRHRLHLVRDTPVLALSGIEHRADVVAMHDGGATGVLVGSSLMSAAAPRDLVRRLRGLVHVKCCGTGHPEDGAEVPSALSAADAVGVVVASPGAVRERSYAEAHALFARLPPDVERIVVTTSTDADRIEEAVLSTGATGVQVHAETGAGRLEDIRARIGDDRTLIGLVRFPAASDEGDPAALVARLVADVQQIFTVADRVLLDAPAQKGAAGGTGVALDLTLAKHVVDMLRPRRIVLAGGLTPQTVEQAVRRVRPWGVDVSSGIETATKGRKDADTIRAFIGAARRVRNVHDTEDEVPLRVL